MEPVRQASNMHRAEMLSIIDLAPEAGRDARTIYHPVSRAHII
jgi:hypothetical protein